MDRTARPWTALALLLAPVLAAAQPAWRAVLELPVSHPVSVAAFVDEEVGLTVGAHGAKFTTRDGGTTWAAAENSSACRYGVELHPGGAAWSAGNHGEVRVSSDHGAHWSAVASFGTSTRVLSFVDARRGLVASADYLGITSDGGRSWTEVKLPRDAGPIAAASLSEEAGAVRLRLLDEDGRIWVSGDAGATWGAAPSPLRRPVMESLRGPHAALRFQPDGTGVLAAIFVEPDGPRGRVYRTRDGGKTWQEETVPAGLRPSAITLSKDGRLLTSAEEGGTVRVYRVE